MDAARLAEALRDPELRVRGWDWSRTRTRMDPFPWSYVDVLREYVTDDVRVLDVGTGGGEIFSSVARPHDVALDYKLEMLAVAREKLPCPLVCGDQHALPFEQVFDVVAERHVGVDPSQVLSVLRPGGVFITQHPGGRICQSIFDAFGWGTNGDFWRRENEAAGTTFWDVVTMADFYEKNGCTILRREEADVDYEFLDEESLAFWLLNAPLPERADPDVHAEILPHVPLETNWHSQLLVVRNDSDVAPPSTPLGRRR